MRSLWNRYSKKLAVLGYIVKKILYAIIPILAFSIIFVNAFFGHLIFTSESQEVVNKYSVYVHLLSEWQSDSKNIIFDVTNSWYKSDKINNVNHVFDAEFKEYNVNQLQEINGKSYVELKHEFSDCQEEWQPMLYRKAVDTVRHEIEYVQGKQLSSNPETSVYPDINNKNYDNSQQQSKIKDGYAQFFPICTSKNFTSYDYSIQTDNKIIRPPMSSFTDIVSFRKAQTHRGPKTLSSKSRILTSAEGTKGAAKVTRLIPSPIAKAPITNMTEMSNDETLTL